MKKILRTTLLLMLLSCTAANGQKLDRGIKYDLFVPKGQWVAGGNFSYSNHHYDDHKFLILNDMSLTSYNIGVSPFFGYFFRNNVAIGGRFGYNRSYAKIDKVNIDLGDDINFSLDDYYSLSHSFYGTAIMRTYITLGSNRRFGFFNEARLTLGGGQGKILSGTGEDLTGTYQNTFEMHVGMSPGLAAFITNDVAVEVMVGVLGFEYKKVTQTTDRIYKGSYDKSGANFKIDLFSISLGLAFYLSGK